MMKKKYKPLCKVGDLLTWRNDKALITELRTYPEGHPIFEKNTYYIVEWSEEQEDGSYIQHKERSPVENIDDAIKNSVYIHYPVKQ